jgi:hypothetical protein
LAVRSFKQLPAQSRQNGLPPIGFSIVTELSRAPDKTTRFTEHRDGKVFGELEVEVFAAALIIDRDGILETMASSATHTPAVAFDLPNASGYRAEAVKKGELPYLQVLAIALDDAIDGGVLVTIRCAQPEWPAAEALLRSLQILTRHGPPANDP